MGDSISSPPSLGLGGDNELLFRCIGLKIKNLGKCQESIFCSHDGGYIRP